MRRLVTVPVPASIAALALALAACSSSGPVNIANHLPPEVTGPTWRWVSTLTVYGELGPGSVPFTVRFTQDDRALIDAGCKGGVAPVGVGDNRQLQVGAVAWTRDTCAGGEDRVTHEFVTDLGRARQWSVKDGDLYLGHPGDAAGLHFTPASAPAQ